MSKTWLPYPSFKESASVLSDTHLTQQRIDILHLLERMHEVEVSRLPEGFKDENAGQTALAMVIWKDCEMQLCEFGLQVSEEWSVRNRQKDPYYEIFSEHLDWATGEDANMGHPVIFGDTEYHEGTKMELLKIDPDWYSSYFLSVS